MGKISQILLGTLLSVAGRRSGRATGSAALLAARSLCMAVIAASSILLTAPAIALVDMRNGNYSETFIDIGFEESVGLTRTYNSRTLFNGLFGFGWCSDLETAVRRHADGSISLILCGAGSGPRLVSADRFRSASVLRRLFAPAGNTAPLEIRSLLAPASNLPLDYGRLRARVAIDRSLLDDYATRIGYPPPPRSPLYRSAVNDVAEQRTDGLVIRTHDGVVYTFDADDQLKAIDRSQCACRTRFGKTAELVYSEGKLSAVILEGKHRVDFEYSPQGKVVRAVSTDGKEARYRYAARDSQQILLEIANAWGNNFEYRYDQFLNLDRITYPDNSFVGLKYDERHDWVSAFIDRRKCMEIYTYVASRDDPANKYSSYVEKRCGGFITNVTRFDFTHAIGRLGERYLSKTVRTLRGKITTTDYAPGNPAGREIITNSAVESQLGFDSLSDDRIRANTRDLVSVRARFDELFVGDGSSDRSLAELDEWLRGARLYGQPALDEWALTAFVFCRDALQKGEGLKVKDVFVEIERIVRQSEKLQAINFFSTATEKFYYTEAASRELDFETAGHAMTSVGRQDASDTGDGTFIDEDLGGGFRREAEERLFITLKAIEFRGRAGTTRELAPYLLQLASAYDDFGDTRAALRVYEFLLAEEKRRRWAGDRAQLSNVFLGLADGYAVLGDYQKAVAFHRRNLELGLDDETGYSTAVQSLLALFFVYSRQLNNMDAARPFFEAARALIDRYDPAGRVFRPTFYRAQSDLLEYDGHYAEALTLAEQTYTRIAQHSYFGASERFSLLTAIAFAAEKLGLFDKALAARALALQIRSVAFGPESQLAGVAMFRLASVYNRMGEHQRALVLLRVALRIHDTAATADASQVLDDLIETESAHEGLGDGASARGLIPRITELIEARRDSATLDAFDRRTLFENFADYYKRFARLYAGSGSPDEGFLLADRSKGRTLVDRLRTQIAAKFLPATERQRLAEHEEALRQFERGVSATAAGETTALALVEGHDAINARRAELAAFNRQLASQYPKYQSYLAGGTLDRTGLHSALRDTEVFLSYSVDQDEKAQLFLVARGRTSVVDLGRLPNYRSTIDALVELTVPYVDSFPGRLVALESGGWRWASDGAASGGTMPDDRAIVTADVAAARTILADWAYRTLIQPALPMIGNSRELIISPDGYLALLPFDILRPADPDGAGAGRLLVENYSIKLVQSFSAFKLLRDREADYSALDRRGQLLAMGNAVYNYTWPAGASGDGGRVRGQARRIRAISTRSIDPATGTEIFWPNLPGTRTEIEGVSTLFGQPSVPIDGCTEGDGVVMICAGYGASKANLLRFNGSGALADYRYLLFSAHGYLDSVDSDRSALVLTLRAPGAKADYPDIDGMVNASEWSFLNLRSDLTVLSACETGVGQPLSGEAIMGLPYAMFIAGNRNTLLTLWPVGDKATAEFMRRFFAKLRNGTGQADALRETKSEFIASNRWRDPKYWAAFVLYGS